MESTLLLLTGIVILPLTTLANPLPTVVAGGPAIIPIPSSCTIYNPLRYLDGYMPSPDFKDANLAYNAYFDTEREPSAVALQCFQQCHGLSGCKSAFYGTRIPTPEGYYDSPGGYLTNGCIMFTEYLAPRDFVPAPQGQYCNISAANIFCP